MAKRTADTELLKSDTKNARIQARSQDRLQDVVRAAYVTKQGQLSDSPITYIAIDGDATWFSMLYWPEDELIGLRVLRHLANPKFHDVGIVQSLMHLCIEDYMEYRDEEGDKLLCRTFDVANVRELGIFRELTTRCPQSDEQTRTAGKVDESDLNPARCTILMYCYE